MGESSRGCGDEMFGDIVMKTLDLVLKRKWYDMIASGEKTEEYREIKPYWIRRLCYKASPFHPVPWVSMVLTSQNPEYLKKALQMRTMNLWGFTHVTFHLGYSKDRPSMTFAIKEIVCDEGKEEWGALPGETYFVIKLGERL